MVTRIDKVQDDRMIALNRISMRWDSHYTDCCSSFRHGGISLLHQVVHRTERDHRLEATLLYTRGS